MAFHEVFTRHFFTNWRPAVRSERFVIGHPIWAQTFQHGRHPFIKGRNDALNNRGLGEALKEQANQQGIFTPEQARAHHRLYLAGILRGDQIAEQQGR